MPVVMPALSAFWELSVAVLFSAGAGFLLWAWLETPPHPSLLDHPYTWRTIWRRGCGRWADALLSGNAAGSIRGGR